MNGNTTWSYTYDNAGNVTAITKKTLNEDAGITPMPLANYTPLLPPPLYFTDTDTLAYTDSEWGDLLTSFNGHTITYDGIGNPLSYYNGSAYNFTWTGRQLTGAVKDSKTMSFTYDDNGIRTSKTVNGVTHTYQLNGSQIVSEAWEDKLLVYLYDVSGSPIGMMYRTTSYELNEWATFFFEKNLQGDIIAIYNESGTKLVTYEYDAWGNQTVTYHAGSSSGPAQYNPFRYRGYYYDTDLGMYYLQSRYYDSKVCRFINADSALYHSMLGYNMFAYCENNPINYCDPSGESATAIIQWWTSLLGTMSVIEPTLIGETILVVGIVVICGISLGEKAYETIDFIVNEAYNPQVTDSFTQDVEDTLGETTISEVKTRTKEEADPNRRPNQKKQGREIKVKSRLKDWTDRNNKRHGRAKLPKHTPSKKGHKKYFTIDKPIKIY